VELNSARLARSAAPGGGSAPTLAGRALALIHAGQAPTRSALTSLLGVTRATIGAVTGELRDLGVIVVEAGPPGRDQPEGLVPGETMPQGRPSHRLLPDPDGPVALAAQLHPDGFEVALVGLGGTVAARLVHDTPASAEPERALALVAAAAARLQHESGRRCVGAAVALPTAVSTPDGTAVRALYLGWPTGTPVRDIFAAQLAEQGAVGPAGGDWATGCAAVNDVNAVALAEHRHGAGRGASHLLVVAAEARGVGGALVLDGALYTGSTGLAMEAGHVTVAAGGRVCVCGNRGCLGMETDAMRFLELAGRDPAPGVPVLRQAEAVLQDGYPDDDQVRAAADAVAARLGLGLAGLINVVNPDRLLLGGLHGTLLRVAPDRLRTAVAAGSPWRTGAAIPIEACALEHGGLIGAAEVAWQPVLDDPALLRSGLSQV
jgi:predicted NBD/HSP70 family sugar kinase